jgi:hypothetical protein
MKKLFFLLLLIPILGMSQTKNVVTATRVFPKVDKILEFEKALAAHAQKYHKGDWAWRVSEIQSGPDFGGYNIVEGPTNWDALDTRGNLGTEHNNDWNKTVAIYLTDRGSSSYSVYQDSLSTIALKEFTEKITITHIFPKPGMVNGVIELIKKLRKVAMESGESVAVYSAVVSGPPQFTVVGRLKAGLKELAEGYRKPMSERYNMSHGQGSWDYYLQDYSKYVESRWSELLLFRADLSSK